MSTAPTGPDFPPLTASEVKPFLKLAGVLRFTGVLLLVTAGCLLVMAVTGHDTPRKINIAELVVAIILLVHAGGALAAGRALRRAMVGGGDRTALVEAATGLLNLLIGVMVVSGMAALAMVVQVVQFLGQVADKNAG